LTGQAKRKQTPLAAKKMFYEKRRRVAVVVLYNLLITRYGYQVILG
jgi:hypothetical protein